MNFRVASNPGAYAQCHELLKEEGIAPEKLGFPTIMALENDRLVGFLSTHIQKQMIVAGPMVIRSDRRRIMTAIRLAEAYEMSMRNLGIKTFIFHGEAGGLLEKAIRRYYPHVAPYATRDGIVFYTWRLTDGKQGLSTRSVS